MRSLQMKIGERWEDIRIIFDSVPALIWYKDAHNRILRANRRAAESLGLTVDALEGASTYDLYPDEAAQYHRDDLEVIRSGRPKLGIIELMPTASGEKRWVRTDKIPYRDEFDTVVGVIVFAVDVTERVHAEHALMEAHDTLEKRVVERTRELADALEQIQEEMSERQRMEEQLRRQQAEIARLQRLRTVEEMAAQIAHEINQPLGAIANFASGLVRRLQDGTVDLAPMRAVATQISQQAMRAANVVRRLRELFQREQPVREPANVAEVVRDAVRVVASNATRQGIAITTTIEPEAAMLSMDRTQIEHTLVNLLANALEAIGDIDERAAGSAEVRVEVRGGAGEAIEIRILDTGPGLPADGADGMFEPFFTTKPAGLGMGLTISRSIVEAHGGTLEARARAEGGAAFVIVLPSS